MAEIVQQVQQQQQHTKMNFLDTLSRPVQLGILSFGVFLFFGLHNYLQEAFMNLPGFEFGVMLGYMEVLGYVINKY